jgi:S1-C subfamily serine protease
MIGSTSACGAIVSTYSTVGPDGGSVESGAFKTACPLSSGKSHVDITSAAADDHDMLRAMAIAIVSSVLAFPAYGQTLSVLRIKIVLLDAGQQMRPVPGHALLISDNPTSAPPRRVVTGPDGTVEVKLRPGNYTVESDRPVSLDGKAYGWTQLVDIAAGRDAVLELNAANAEIGAITAGADAKTPPPDTDPAFLSNQWQGSVVAIWTPTARGSGFIVDAGGLVATNQRIIGTATAVEVQLTATTKVAGTVLVSDQQRGVAVIRIDPTVSATVAAVPLGCGQRETVKVAEGQEIFTIGVVPRRGTDSMFGRVRRVDPRRLSTDLRLEPAAAGGPVFSDQGAVIGITAVLDEPERNRADAHVVRIEDACAVVASAQQSMAKTAAPSGAHLPIEPTSSVSMDALKSAATRRVGSLHPYLQSSATFDVAFFTPILTYAAHYPLEPPAGRVGGSGTRTQPTSVLVRPVTDFANWSEYVADIPPVVLVRVTPRLVESFWTTVARGAAQTQGVAVPSLKRAKSGFLRMQAYCGDMEVTPIHPFTLNRAVSERDTISEGLYVFDPDAFAARCGTVKFTLYAEKEPSKPETIVINPSILQQISADFAAYRTADR